MPQISSPSTSIWGSFATTTTHAKSDLSGTSNGSPESMSAFFAPPLAPIGWHLTPTKPASRDTYRPFANRSPPIMASDGEGSPEPTRADPQDFLSRYQQLKEIEGYKNHLIEELLYSYQDVCQQLQKSTPKRNAELQEIESLRYREQRYAENVRRMQFLLDRDPFVLVLIDAGNSTTFRTSLIAQGAPGGKIAGDTLQLCVKARVAQLLPDLSDDVRVVVRVFGDMKSLADGCQLKGLVDATSKMQQFTRGLSTSHPLLDFIDVSNDSAAEKVSEAFKLHVNDYHCRQIMLCCNNDAKYVQLLTDASLNEHTHPRVTLIENVPYASSISELPFQSVVFDNLFDFPAARIDTPMLSRQLSNIKMGDIKEFTPSAAIVPPPAAARPAATIIPAATKAPAPAPTSASANASPGNLWAAIAAKPAVPITPPPAPAVLASSSTSKSTDGISRNRKGQRIDPPIKHDKQEVERVKKLKMCNNHYLRGPCPLQHHCPHVHTYKPTSAELTTLRLVARMAPCVNGSECEEVKCIYGHICPAPLQRDGKVTKDGKDCIFHDDCRFAGSLHLRGEDRKEVKLIRVT